MNGDCITYMGEEVWERRVFKNGILMSEETSFMDPIRKRTTYFRKENPKDSIFAEYKQFSETGTILRLVQYYYNRHGRRGFLETVYDGYQHPRKLSNYVWFYAKEVTDHTSEVTPEHTVDPEGYASYTTPIGPQFEYHANGKLQSRTEHVFDYVTIINWEWSMNGPFVRYHENGRIAQQGTYINGKEHGEWNSYTPEGQIIEHFFYDNGLPVGNWVAYHYNSTQPILTKEYNDSLFKWLVPKELRYNEKGTLIYDKEILLSGKGYEKHFFADGHLSSAKYYEHGPTEIHSQSEYYENHQLKSKSYLRSQDDTIGVEYFASGQLKMLNLTHHDDQDSYWQKVSNYYENGQLLSYAETQHHDGSTEQERYEYYDNGTKSMETLYKNRQTVEREFYRNGSLKFEKNRTDNFLDGTWLEKDSLGNIAKKCLYKQGFRLSNCASSPTASLLKLSKEEESLMRYFLIKGNQWNMFSEQNFKPEIIDPRELKEKVEVLGVVYRLCEQNGWSFGFHEFAKLDTLTYTFTGFEQHYNQNKSFVDSLLRAYDFALINESNDGSYITKKYSNTSFYNQAALDSIFLTPLSKMNGRIMFNYPQYEIDYGLRRARTIYQETRISLDKQGEAYVVEVITANNQKKFTVYSDSTIEFYNGQGDWKIDLEQAIPALWWD
jgi:antitoxin component YwqK of YwqJK toxin-antitoxin module